MDPASLQFRVIAAEQEDRAFFGVYDFGCAHFLCGGIGMTKIIRLPTMILYGLAVGGLVFYMFCSLNPQIIIPPAARLILMGMICVSSYFGSLLFSKTTTEQTAHKIMKTTFAVFLGLYVLLLITLVLFDRYFGRIGFLFFTRLDSQTREYYLQGSFNIIPFKTIYEFISGALINSTVSLKIAITNIFGNLIAFAPFALFLPLLFDKMKSFKIFTMTLLCLVVAVEILQLFLLTGSCDIDDIILNVAGACAAYCLLNIKGIKKAISKITMLSY